MDNEGRATGDLDLGLDRPRADGRVRGGRGGFHRQRRLGPLAERKRETYAALDLGTNNCRLLIARPSGDGFRVIDAFSRMAPTIAAC
jgi:exopolyphosphatase/guanosine-5'-triphosphate,3'-diphosphate pyrophosphatase